MLSRNFGALTIGLLLATGCGPMPPAPPAMTGYEVVRGTGVELVAQALGSLPGVMNSGTATAGCPGTKVVVGGGFKAQDEAANVFDNAPTLSGNAWRVAAKNENFIPPIGPATVFVEPFAICVDRPAGYQILTARNNLSTGQNNSAEAFCPDATFRSTGGGVMSSGPLVRWFANSVGSKSQPSWIGSFKSNWIVVPSNSRVDTAVICAEVLAVPGKTVVTSQPATLATPGNAVLSVKCPAGTKVLSGGVLSAERDAIWFDSAPTPQGDGWTASLRNATSPIGPVAITGTLTAVCAIAVP